MAEPTLPNQLPPTPSSIPQTQSATRERVQSTITPGEQVLLSPTLEEPKPTLKQQAGLSLNALGRTLGRSLLAAGAVIGSPLLGPMMILEVTSSSEPSQKSLWSELKQSFQGGTKDVACTFKIFSALWSAIPSPFRKKDSEAGSSFILILENTIQDLYSLPEGISSFTLTTSTLKPHNSDVKPTGYKLAMELAHGKKKSETELEILGVSAASVRATCEQKANFNADAKVIITDEVFGNEGYPDHDVMVNFSDQHFGGVIRSASNFALEEILTHCSSQLLALQESKTIPLQRDGLANAGQGKSHASSIRNVQFEIEVDTRKRVNGPDGQPLPPVWGDGAKVIFQVFEKKYGKKAPQEMAKALIQQGIIKKKEPPTTKTVLNQVAPTLTLRAEAIRNAKSLNKPYEGPKHATKEEVEDYFYAVDAGIEALVAAKQKEAKTGTDVYYPAGWFGAGAFSNPGELAALTQLSLAAFRGINVVFHNVAADKEKRTAQLTEAQKLFEQEILPMIKNSATKGEVLAKIQELAAAKKWPIGDLSLD